MRVIPLGHPEGIGMMIDPQLVPYFLPDIVAVANDAFLIMQVFDSGILLLYVFGIK